MKASTQPSVSSLSCTSPTSKKGLSAITCLSGTILQNDHLFLPGFGSYLQSEALPESLPQGQNHPQKCKYGLYTELLSGTTFTTPRLKNQSTYFYRIRPTAGHPPFEPVFDSSSSSSSSSSSASASSSSAAVPLVTSNSIGDFSRCRAVPNQFRWPPLPLPSSPSSIDFVQGLHTICGSGSPDLKTGLAIHMYACNKSMGDKAIVNSDGDWLIVPQMGTLRIRTEMGWLIVGQGSMAVVQRGIAFSVQLDQDVKDARGYICEVYSGHFTLPELGPIGSHGLANARDFLHPTASFEDRLCNFVICQKFGGEWFSYTRESSPFDVVAWAGNYVPYQYDLNLFCPVGAVRVDHIDPSVFTVLTCPTTEAGVACADFVLFPPRWAVQEHTFRPPYYHRNTASEFMGNIYGRYEAKPEGFEPGGASLHSMMVGHGPDAATHEKASMDEQMPQRLSDESLSFMFESTFMLRVTDFALKQWKPDPEYWKCWTGLPRAFSQIVKTVKEEESKQQE